MIEIQSKFLKTILIESDTLQIAPWKSAIRT